VRSVQRLVMPGGKVLKNALTGFFILALLLSAGIAVTDQPKVPKLVGHALRSPDFRYYEAGLILAVLCVFILRSRGIKLPPPSTPGPPVPIDVSLKEVAEAQLASSHYGEDAIMLLFQTLTDLPRYLVRINEDVELLDDSPQLRITKRHLYRLSSPGNSGTVLVPIARLEKGTLLDSFDVRDAADECVPTVSYVQLRGLLSLTLEVVIKFAIKATHDSKNAVDRAAYMKDVTDAQKDINELTRELILKMCGPPRVRKNSQDPQVVTQAEAIVRNEHIRVTLEKVNELPVGEGWKGRIRSFCELYIDSYVILAEVEYGNHLMLSYSHLVPANVIPSGKESWRRIFGLRPSTIDIALNTMAFQVETYHQELTAQSGQYVFQHRLEHLDTPTEAKQAEFETATSWPYVRVYYNDARSNAHLYVRRQMKPKNGAPGQAPVTGGGYTKRLKSVIELREIPPGTLGAAAVVALASAAIISFFAISHTGLDIDPNVTGSAAQNEQIKATLNSDIPALLLALPAFIGVLIGSWLELSRLRRASLTTYLALAMTMFLSIASALFFVFDANRKLPTALTVHIAYGDSTLRTDWIWLLLMAVAITHFLFLARSLVNESRHFSQRGKKPVEG
jgi:hypothetical protein